jgi:hypothetical protein
VVDTPSVYNAILGRKTLNAIGAVISLTFLKIKFLISNGIGEECGHQMMARTCYVMSVKSKNSDSAKGKMKMTSKEAFEIRSGEEIARDSKDSTESKDTIELDDEVEDFVVGEGKKLNIDKALIGQAREDLTQFLIKNIDVFVWSASDMPSINRQLLSISYTSIQDISQFNNRRGAFKSNDNVQFGLRWRSYSRLVSFEK